MFCDPDFIITPIGNNDDTLLIARLIPPSMRARIANKTRDYEVWEKERQKLSHRIYIYICFRSDKSHVRRAPDESQVNGTDIAGEQRIEIFFRVRTAMRDLAVYGESADKSALCLMGSPFVEGSLTTYPRERERERKLELFSKEKARFIRGTQPSSRAAWLSAINPPPLSHETRPRLHDFGVAISAGR